LPAVFFRTETGREPVRDWLCAAKMPTSKAARNRNKHRGASFESFLKKEGLHEEVHAAALKRALALKLHELMKKNCVNKSTMASQMRTSRAAIHRLLAGPTLIA
jgi:hypothetical protein